MHAEAIGLLLISSILLSYLAPSVFTSKTDCFPTPGANKDACEARGCIWSPVDAGALHKPSAEYNQKLPYTDTRFVDIIKQTQSRVNEPWCYFPEGYKGYDVVEADSSGKRYKLVRNKPSGLPDEIKELIVSIEEYKSVLRIKIIDANHQRFEPAIPSLTLEDDEKKSEFKHSVDQQGHLIVQRESTGAVLLDIDLGKILYADKFIQLNSKLNSPFVYGLGEHYDTFLKLADSYKTYSFWNTDRLPLPGGTRSYGGFPFYVNFDSKNKHAHGVYLRNSNAMDVVLQSDQSITWRPIGGVIDFLVFSGPTPHDVISQYQHTVGLPQLPPRWALGFHLCRYNYNSLEKTKLVMRRTRDANIPFDVQWNDIDYMDRHNDFSYDHDKFKGLPEFVDELHEKNMHYVILFDPGVSQEDNYLPYELGKNMDIFVKNATNQTLVGKVWNDSGKTVFPDFSWVRGIDYWGHMFREFHKEVKFDGAWIDMNDISNFVDGSLDGCPYDNPLEQPIYKPGGIDLQQKTLCLSAQHLAGSEYNVHNLYAFYETIATSQALQLARPNKRPLIISRSTAPGQGHFGGHWSGDVLSNWDYLKWSIPSLIEHSMYGYSLIGSDICGFLGDTSPQLCARWSTLGAFYTFSRNHNDDTSIDQDPVALGPEVVEANKNALTKRYSLLPYLYTLIHRAHKFGEPAIRSVPFEFYTDPEALKVEYEFLWGKGLLISPVVDADSYYKITYLPEGRWYETDVLPAKANSAKPPPKWIDSKGEWYETKGISLTNIPLFHRGGHILPVYATPKQTIPEIVKQPIGLEIALCAMNRAHGDLFIDDGDSLDNKHNYATMKLANNRLVVKLDRDDYAPTIAFGHVKIYGANSTTINEIKVNEKQISFQLLDHVLSFDLNGATVSKQTDLIVQWN